MEKISIIVTTTFGLESVVKKELRNLGIYEFKVSDGKIEFDGSLDDIPRLNIWLRCADRVLIKLSEFHADDFDKLFDSTKEIPWDKWIEKDSIITVVGKSVRSKLQSVRSNQSIVKKAIVESLKQKYKTDWLNETGIEFTISVSILNDIVQITLDTSGSGLHKRGYRLSKGEAPIRENLAAALVLLSEWNKEEMLVDAFCGSGTILIEAALIARNIAPGLNRHFISEDWKIIDKKSWDYCRTNAKELIDKNTPLKIYGYDIDINRINDAKSNAKKAGVLDDIIFEEKDIRDLWIDSEHGTLISNPPYGVKLSSARELTPIYISIHNTFKKKFGWAVCILTSDKRFPNFFKRSRPTKIRKLFNGALEANYYQYY